MNLLQVRSKFRDISGRFDLVHPDGVDNGADFFINEGQKFLDRLGENQKSWSNYFVILSINAYYTSIPSCRAIKEVWASSTTARWQLEKKNLNYIFTEYLSGDPASRTSGSPLYYSPAISRHIPKGIVPADFAPFNLFAEMPASNAENYNAVILNTPISESLLLEVRGFFYTNELSDDTDENYWSVNHPLLLVMAAMRQIEVVNRNTQGVNDWDNSIKGEITSLNMDLVDEVISEVDQMEG